MKMTTRVAYCNMRHYKSKNILIGIAIILTTLLLFVIPSIGKDMVEVNFAVINKIYPTWHALYRNVDESTVMKLAAHHDVKTYGLRSDAGYMNLEDATVSMMYMDRTGMELYKVKLKEGQLPQDNIAINPSISTVRRFSALYSVVFLMMHIPPFLRILLHHLPDSGYARCQYTLLFV